MPKLTGQTLVALVEESGFKPYSYSGRGMFGKNCVSVRCDRETSEWDVAWSLAETVFDNGESETQGSIRIPTPNHDSFGLGTVLYWPSVEWPSETGNDNG